VCCNLHLLPSLRHSPGLLWGGVLEAAAMCSMPALLLAASRWTCFVGATVAMTVLVELQKDLGVTRELQPTTSAFSLLRLLSNSGKRTDYIQLRLSN
jgi:hypothetical protein